MSETTPTPEPPKDDKGTDGRGKPTLTTTTEPTAHTDGRGKPT
jgi:hypothetical protein